MGPPDDVPLAEVAARVEAALRFGWFEDAVVATELLVSSQRGRGGFGHDGETLAAVEALAAWRVAGVPREHLDHVVVALAAGAHRLRRRRNKGDVEVDAVDAALAHAAWMLRAAGRTRRRPSCAPTGRRRHRSVPRPTDSDPIAGVVAELDRVAAETDDGIDLFAGWDASWLGTRGRGDRSADPVRTVVVRDAVARRPACAAVGGRAVGGREPRDARAAGDGGGSDLVDPLAQWRGPARGSTRVAAGGGAGGVVLLGAAER